MFERFELLNVDITAATSATAVPGNNTLYAMRALGLEAIFTYGGSGGTSAKAYVQTSFDAGETWIDIACFAFATTTASKVGNLSALTPVTTLATPTDGSLSDNSVVDGILGDRIRVKYVTEGTYAAGTNLTIHAMPKP